MLVVVRMTVSTFRYNALHDFALKRIMNHDVCRDSILSFVALQCCLISLARDIGCSAGVSDLQYLTQIFLGVQGISLAHFCPAIVDTSVSAAVADRSVFSRDARAVAARDLPRRDPARVAPHR